MSTDLLSIIRSVGIDLDRIECIYIIDGVLTNTEPLRIGKGAGGLGEVDLPVIRSASGTPYIPGSSLKGVLRSVSELLIRSNGAKACEPNPQSRSFNECSLATELLTKVYQYIVSGRQSDIENVNDFRERLLRNLRSRYVRKLGEKVFNDIEKEIINTLESGGLKELVSTVIRNLGPCLACQIFGNTSLASHVQVLDALPASNDIPVLMRTRVAIDRFRGAARSRALFEYEYVPRGVKWRFRLVIRNIDLMEDIPKSRVIKSLINSLYHGSELTSVGGMRSVGSGIIRLDPTRTTITKYMVKGYSFVRKFEKRLREVIE